MGQQVAVGVDIGGTKIAFALVNEHGQVLASHRLPTDAERGPEAVLERVAQGVRALLDTFGQPVQGVGIGCPGYVDARRGTVNKAVNLGWMEEMPLRGAIERRLGLPVWIENDTNAGALGEFYFGAARGTQNVVYVAIGTGLGGGAIVDGRLLTGGTSFAMEIGHLSHDPAGRLCSCGLRGCTETVVSGVGLLASIHEFRGTFPNSPLAQMSAPSTVDILHAAEAGDPLARAALGEAATWLGIVLARCTGILNPECVVIGGGLGKAAFRWLVPEAERELRRRVLLPTYEQLSIVESQIADSAIGAACLVWHGLRYTVVPVSSNS